MKSLSRTYAVCYMHYSTYSKLNPSVRVTHAYLFLWNLNSSLSKTLTPVKILELWGPHLGLIFVAVLLICSFLNACGGQDGHGSSHGNSRGHGVGVCCGFGGGDGG